MSDPNEEEVETHPKVSSIVCKGCKKSFKSNSILKHLNQTKKKCLLKYSKSEIANMKNQSRIHSKFKEKQWRIKNKDKIKETNRNYFHENMDEIYERREVKKEEKIFEEQCKKIEEQKLSHENNLKQFIQSCYKKARSSNKSNTQG